MRQPGFSSAARPTEVAVSGDAAAVPPTLDRATGLECEAARFITAAFLRTQRAAVRLRDAAPLGFFTRPDDFGREPEGCFALPPDTFFPSDAADFLAVARDGGFAVFFDRVFVLVSRNFVVDVDRFFAVDTPFRERAVAVGLRAGAAAAIRRGLVAGLEVVSPLEPIACCVLESEGALGNVDGSTGEVPAGADCRISNRSRTRLCASFCLLRTWRISSPCRSRPATL